MSDYKQNETTRFPNVLFRSISQQKKLHRVSLVEFEEFKSMCRVYAKEKGMIFDEAREMFYIEDTKS
jgi:hypothetical protein